MIFKKSTVVGGGGGEGEGGTIPMSLTVVNVLASFSSFNMLHKYNESLFSLLPSEVLYIY